MENKIILVDSDEAAKQITIPAWFRAIQYKFIIKSKMIDNDIEFVKYLISKY